MSALVFTVVVAVQRLSLLSGSALPLETSALLTRIVPAATSELTLTTATIDAEAPLARLPRLHLSGLLGSPGTTPDWHDPVVGVALTKLTWAGSASSTKTFGATDGPSFVTV